MTSTRPSPLFAPSQLALPFGGRSPSLVVIDLQATGVSPDRHEIIHIVAARLDADGSVGATFSTYVRPRNRVPRHITALTGIHDADVADAPTAPEALRTLARFVEDAANDGSGDLIIITLKGHIPFIAAACARHALPMRPVRFVDSLWFFFGFWATFFANYSDVVDLIVFITAPDMADLFDVIETDMDAPWNVVPAIEDWLGIDASGLPHPRHDGTDFRVRLFAGIVRRVVQSPSWFAHAKDLQAKACEHNFIATS